MLVLTRRQQEKIRIGENITITILRMKGKTVRLGIEAPSEVPVLRGELVVNLVDGETAPEVKAKAETSPVQQKNRVETRGCQPSAWTRETNPSGGSGPPRGDAMNPEVSLQRLSHRQAGPLRSMIESRTG